MLLKKWSPLPALLLVFLFSSCTKNNLINEPENILGTWYITGITSNAAYDWDGDGRTETDILSTYSSCRRDIVMTFESNGYGRIREGCNAPYENLYWQFTNNNRNLDISYSGGELNLEIQQSTGSVIRGTDIVTANGRSFTITYTLQRG